MGGYTFFSGHSDPWWSILAAEISLQVFYFSSQRSRLSALRDGTWKCELLEPWQPACNHEVNLVCDLNNNFLQQAEGRAKSHREFFPKALKSCPVGYTNLCTSNSFVFSISPPPPSLNGNVLHCYPRPVPPLCVGNVG